MEEMILRSLNGETSPPEEQELAQWRAATPANEERYQQLVRLHEAARLIQAPLHRPAPDPEQFLSELDRRVIVRRSQSQRRGVWTAWAVAVGSAAAVAALTLGLAELRKTLDNGSLDEIELVTGPGETTTATLGEGRAVHLGPKTRLRIARGSGKLDVWLDGRAYFSIARKPGRTFRVRTEGGDAVVLGTRFDLEARHGDLRVVVVEGSVRVVARGIQLEVGSNEMGTVVDRRAPRVEPVEDVHTLLGWMNEFIAFEGTPLREVALELERRFGTPIEIRSEELAEREVTGWSAGRSVDEIIDAICRTIAARCSRVDGVAVFEL